MADTVITPAAEGTTPAVVTSTTPGVGGDPWFKGADTETLGYLQNRGLDKKDAKDAAFAAITAHRNAEAKLGAPADQLLRMPKDAGDSAAFDAIYQKLGRPAKADEYNMAYAKEKGATDDFIKFTQEFAFKRGLSKDAGEALAKEFVDYAEKVEATGSAGEQEKVALSKAALQKDWGFNFEANKIIARNAALKVGISPEAVAALESTAGYAATMEALRKIGVAIGESRFISSETTGNVMTNAGAVERKQALMNDKEWVGKYLAGDTNAVKEMTNLNTLIAKAMTA